MTEQDPYKDISDGDLSSLVLRGDKGASKVFHARIHKNMQNLRGAIEGLAEDYLKRERKKRRREFLSHIPLVRRFVKERV